MSRGLEHRPMRARPLAGWIAGCVVASLAIAILGAIDVAVSSGRLFLLPWGLIIFFGVTSLLLFVVGALTAIPDLMVIWICELFEIRSVLFFGGCGAVIGGVCQFLLWRALGHPP